MSAAFTAAFLILGALLWWFGPELLGMVGLREFGDAALVALVILVLSLADRVWVRFR